MALDESRISLNFLFLCVEFYCCRSLCVCGSAFIGAVGTNCVLSDCSPGSLGYADGSSCDIKIKAT